MSLLDKIEELLLRIKNKHNIVKETLAFVEEYKNRKKSKEELVSQLRTCFATITNDKLFGNYSPHDIDNPYSLFNKLINDFNSERGESENMKEKIRKKLNQYLKGMRKS